MEFLQQAAKEILTPNELKWINDNQEWATTAFKQLSEEFTEQFPPIDLYPVDDHYVLKADIPGISKQDIKLQVVNDTITLSGRFSHESANGSVYAERPKGTFRRKIQLPFDTEPESVSAQYTNGVLILTIASDSNKGVVEID